MPGPRGRGMLPRRRRDDEGEDESSITGDLDDFSISEGSAISNGDEEAEIEGSDVSIEAEDEDIRAAVEEVKSSDAVPEERTAVSSLPRNDAVTQSAPPPTNPKSLTNGAQHGSSADQNKARSHQIDTDSGDTVERTTSSAPQLPQTHETPAERSRREHLEYVRQRNSNPAFVPNRGGFFLHDDRSATTASQYGRQPQRGRGRGYNNVGYVYSASYLSGC